MILQNSADALPHLIVNAVAQTEVCSEIDTDYSLADPKQIACEETPMVSPTIETTLHTLELQLERLLQWIRASESRIAFVITLSTAMLGGMAVLLRTNGEFAGFFCWAQVWIVATSLLLVGSISLSVIAAFPITKDLQESLIYFGSIDNLRLAHYVRKIKSRTREDYLEDLVTQCYRNSQIAARKYRWVQRSIVVLCVAAIPWIALMFWLGLQV